MTTCDHERAACRPGLPAAPGRRTFIKLATLGAGVALLYGAAPRLALAGHAKALMLSCMDYRLIDANVSFMREQGLDKEYDYVILAGASLGVVSDKFADWHATFWQHLDVAIKLHAIEEVIVVDHRDCGAYRLALGADAVATSEKELAAHVATLTEFARQVRDKQPKLGLQAFLMGLDGKAEPIKV
ncbi:MAG: carbonic anhydrase [Dongiaceae bacterium]